MALGTFLIQRTRLHLEQLRASGASEGVPAVSRHEGQTEDRPHRGAAGGFKECWQKKDYATIVQMAKRVPEAVMQEDPALLMYFDNACCCSGD